MFGRHRREGAAIDVSGDAIMSLGVDQFHDGVAVFWHIGDGCGDCLGDAFGLWSVAVRVAKGPSSAP